MTAPLIHMSKLAKHYRVGGATVEALCGIDLDIWEGEFVAIMGPSGSGKTTLLNLLGVLDSPTQGRYILGGADVSHLDHSRRARTRNRNIGFVFQAFNLLARNTAIENVELPLIYRGISKAARRESAEMALEAVGLADRRNHWPLQLSGGEQQRVAMARALVTDPLLILADEPTGALDSRTGEEVLDLLEQLHDANRTIVMVTHDRQVARHARRIVTFRDGHIVKDEAVSRATSPAADPEGAAGPRPCEAALVSGR